MGREYHRPPRRLADADVRQPSRERIPHRGKPYAVEIDDHVEPRNLARVDHHGKGAPDCRPAAARSSSNSAPPESSSAFETASTIACVRRIGCSLWMIPVVTANAAPVSM